MEKVIKAEMNYIGVVHRGVGAVDGKNGEEKDEQDI